jgi:hypothetical protein
MNAKSSSTMYVLQWSCQKPMESTKLNCMRRMIINYTESKKMILLGHYILLF